jgi:hypothetical protein
MEHLLNLQLNATLLTVGVSFVFLVRLWRENELFGAQEIIFCLWFSVALIIQIFARSVGGWIAGLLAQFALAVVLDLKEQIDNIY